jgi:hypothetical protein
MPCTGMLYMKISTSCKVSLRRFTASSMEDKSVNTYLEEWKMFFQTTQNQPEAACDPNAVSWKALLSS